MYNNSIYVDSEPRPFTLQFFFMCSVGYIGRVGIKYTDSDIFCVDESKSKSDHGLGISSFRLAILLHNLPATNIIFSIFGIWESPVGYYSRRHYKDNNNKLNRVPIANVTRIRLNWALNRLKVQQISERHRRYFLVQAFVPRLLTIFVD